MNGVDPLAWRSQALTRIANRWPASDLDLPMPWNVKPGAIILWADECSLLSDLVDLVADPTRLLRELTLYRASAIGCEVRPDFGPACASWPPSTFTSQ
jgi:hypothetical protein